MDILIHAGGKAHCVYDEAIPIRLLGSLSIQRASHVEPTNNGQWIADLSPVNGPSLGPFVQRTDALQAEVAWLHNNWLERRGA